MSYHWENVIWQSKDGSWNRGYFKRISSADHPSMWCDPDYGYDSEWDDDFDPDEFDYLATDLRSLEAAHDFTPAGNPGSSVEIPYKGNSKGCKALDKLAFFHRNPEAKAKNDRLVHNRRRREHFAKLAEEWPADKLLPYTRVRVDLKGDDAVYERTGMHSDLEGPLMEKGDWLTVEGKRVFNRKTGKFHNRVVTIQRIPHGRRW